MNAITRQRKAIACAGFAIAVLFGGVGMWQRQTELGKPIWDGKTLEQTTAVFHIWPWPLKLAMVVNLPAVLLGGMLSSPLAPLSATLGAILESVLTLFLAVALWLAVGSRLERRSAQQVRISLSLFIGASLSATFVPMGHTGFVPIGVLIWLIFAFWLWRAGPSSKKDTTSSNRE